MQSLVELSNVFLKRVCETFSNSCFKSTTSSLRGAYSTNPSTTREVKSLREFPKKIINLSVRSSQGSCFKVLWESRKWPAPFVEERKVKLLSKMRGNSAKCVSVEKKSPEVLYKKKLVLKISPYTFGIYRLVGNYCL